MTLAYSRTRREQGHAATIAAFVLCSVSCGGTGTPPQSGGTSPRSDHAGRTVADAGKREQGPSDEAVTNAVVEARLRELMSELPPKTVAYRIALGDVAYPANSDESRRLGGFTLLFVSAVTHDAAELPPHVFFRSSRGDFALPLLLSRIGELGPPELRTVFGPHRFDGLYAIPLQATQVDGKLLANFKNGRRDFHLLTFPGSGLPEGVEPIPPGEPDMNAVRALAEREFPIVEERALVPK